MTSALELALYKPVGMVVIHDQVLAADAASFDVQNIPQGYKHLHLVWQARGATAATTTTSLLRFNNDSGSNYYYQVLAAAAGTATAFESLAASSIRVGSAAAASAGGGVTTGVGIVDIPNYAGAIFHKSINATGGRTISTGSGDSQTEHVVGRWASVAAINRITLFPGAGDWLAGSRLTIYGLGGATQAEVLSIDGWTTDPATWTYASATTFTVSGDQTAKFSKGTRIKLTQTTVKYFVVIGSSHAAGTTTVTITGGSNYSLANAAITDNSYSYAANPRGYIGSFNYDPTYTGFSAAPSNATKFSIIGNVCMVLLEFTPGTSNATTFRFTLPPGLVPAGGNAIYGPIRYQNNGANSLTPGMWEAPMGDNTVYLYRDWGGLGWTASGAKAASFVMHFVF